MSGRAPGEPPGNQRVAPFSMHSHPRRFYIPPQLGPLRRRQRSVLANARRGDAADSRLRGSDDEGNTRERGGERNETSPFPHPQKHRRHEPPPKQHRATIMANAGIATQVGDYVHESLEKKPHVGRGSYLVGGVEDMNPRWLTAVDTAGR